MNVFVLCAGRTASMTFARAANYIEGFTAGHETRVSEFFDERVNYPDQHIEVDNRLAFFLGALERRYGDRACYVHLTRDEDKVAASYRRRWYYRGSIVRAFYTHIMQGTVYSDTAMDEACRFYVRTNRENIEAFLASKSRTFHFEVDRGVADFRRFVDWLGARCAPEGYEVWSRQLNQNRRGGMLSRMKGAGGKMIRTARALPTVYRDM